MYIYVYQDGIELPSWLKLDAASLEKKGAAATT